MLDGIILSSSGGIWIPEFFSEMLVWQVVYSLMVLYSHHIVTSCGHCNVIGLLGINMP